MTEKHYKGGCQCGAVAYEVDVDIDTAMTCNCSRCQRMGFVLAFAPRDKFERIGHPKPQFRLSSDLFRARSEREASRRCAEPGQPVVRDRLHAARRHFRGRTPSSERSGAVPRSGCGEVEFELWP